MTAEWDPPETLLAQLEMMPGIPRTAGCFILRRAALHFAQDESIRKSPAQWRQIMSRWACKAWQDPKERAAARAGSEAPAAQQVGGFHEGPVEPLHPPKSWTDTFKNDPSPPEAAETLRLLREGRPIPEELRARTRALAAPAGNVAPRQGQKGGGA